VRRRRAAKQCIRLGAIGHFCGCQRRLTNAHTDGNGYSDSHADSDANTDANCNANSDDHTGTDCETYAAPAAASYVAAEAIRRDFRAIS
jgi:hypothetical protein